MTIEAVNKFVGKGVLSDQFRDLLTSRKITPKEIGAVDADLDSQDVNAIVVALMNTGSFATFAAAINEYMNLRYRGATPGDDLPISV